MRGLYGWWYAGRMRGLFRSRGEIPRGRFVIVAFFDVRGSGTLDVWPIPWLAAVEMSAVCASDAEECVRSWSWRLFVAIELASCQTTPRCDRRPTASVVMRVEKHEMNDTAKRRSRMC